MTETGNREEAIKVKFSLKEAMIGDAAFYRRVSVLSLIHI